MSLKSKNKTPAVKTFGVLFFGFVGFLCSVNLHAECGVSLVETAQLERVYDGDTVKLTDGRHVRVLGINTPEIDHGKERSGQPLGEEARRATEVFFAKSKSLQLSYDELRVDRYGRTLAHIYDSQGNSLAAYLLRMGLGFQISVPPNVSSGSCLRNAEIAAKKQRSGVWGNTYWKPTLSSDLTLNDTGFKLVRGKVTKVTIAKSVWLELNGLLVLKITPSDMKYFAVQDWQRWQSKQVEVRGWIADRSDDGENNNKKVKKAELFKPLVLQLRTADALMALE